MAQVTFENVSKIYKGHVEALRRLDLVDHCEASLLELRRQHEIADEDLLQDDPAVGQALPGLDSGHRRELFALL